MARRPRPDIAGFPLHLVQRGNNRADCFFSDFDRTAYVRWLGQYAADLGVAIHAWVLMTNHVHLLLTPPSTTHVSLLMQMLGRRYVRYVNHNYNRSGTLWEGRFRACAVHAEGYLINCMRYIELNPLRAGLVSDPGEHLWSSYRRNALGRADPLVVEHSLYTALGTTLSDRQSAYRKLIQERLNEGELKDIRTATSSGNLLASEPFRKQLERTRGAPLGPAPRGRPKKNA